MSMSLRQVGPCLAAEVDGLDLTRPLSPEAVAAIHAGMDTYAVLVFHDQKLDDEQQLVFTRSLGEIEHAIGTSLRAPDELRLPTTFADVSNLDKDQNVFARAFLRDLVEHATQRQFVYAHRWRVGDLVMWDNRQTMHRARPFPAHEPRDMRRTTLAGDGPTVAHAA